MKQQSISVLEWRKSVHYWGSSILFSPECKELTSILDPLLYRWGVPPVVIRRVHWTMQMWVLQTWIIAQGSAIVMMLHVRNLRCNRHVVTLHIAAGISSLSYNWSKNLILDRHNVFGKYCRNNYMLVINSWHVMPSSFAFGAPFLTWIF